MTSQNMYRLAEAGRLGQSPNFGGYCVSAAIDACFDRRDVPLKVYNANLLAFNNGEIGHESTYTDNYYQLLGSLVFGDKKPQEFAATPYVFGSYSELRTDLQGLRDTATVLLDVEDGRHSVGLKPYGNIPDEWQIVGSHQIIAVAHAGKLDIQCLIEPEPVTTKQVWDYLRQNNSLKNVSRTGLVFPPEPI